MTVEELKNLTQKDIRNMIEGSYGENAKYLLRLSDVQSDIHYFFTCKDRFLDYAFERIFKTCEVENKRMLTPVTVRVGDGVTGKLWTDCEAYTVIRKTASTITVQRDKATLKKSFKPEWVTGGFSAVCVNSTDQEYDYERDTEGEVLVCHWSEKKMCYTCKKRSLTFFKGRHEFYDYNF